MTESPLKEYLLDKAIENELLAHSLHWHLELERNNDSNEPKMKDFYNEMWEELMGLLEDQSPQVYDAIKGGREFKDKMHEVSMWLNTSCKRLKVDAKKAQFRAEMKNQSS